MSKGRLSDFPRGGRPDGHRVWPASVSGGNQICAVRLRRGDRLGTIAAVLEGVSATYVGEMGEWLPRVGLWEMDAP